MTPKVVKLLIGILKRLVLDMIVKMSNLVHQQELLLN